MGLNYDIIYCLTIPLYVIAVYYLFSIFLGGEKNRKIEICSYFVFGVLLIGWYFVSTIPVYNFLITIISYSVLSLNYKAELLKRVLSIFYILFITLALETTLTIIFLDIDTNLFIDSEAHISPIIVVVRTVMLLVSYLMHRLIHNVTSDYKVPINNYIFYVFILSGVLYLYLTSVNNSTLSALNVTVNSIVLIFVVILLILNDEKIYKSILLYAERNILREQNLSYENQNKILTQSDANIKMLKHDMNNHLIALQSICAHDNKEQLLVYIQSLMSKIEDSKRFSESNNYVVDSLINFKMQEISNLNIDLTVDVKLPHEINISAYDLTVILGNLIDNAVEALKQVKNYRKLNIYINIEKGNLIINIENTYNGQLNIVNGEFSTTKTYKSMHGLGLENVKKALQKYNGKIDIAYSDNLVSVIVLVSFVK